MKIARRMRLRRRSADTAKYHASKGWFDGIKSTACLYDIELTGQSSSADKEGAQECVKTFSEIVGKDGYFGRQIFCVDERGLLWKKKPA
jgi:hypothetical protein